MVGVRDRVRVVLRFGVRVVVRVGVWVTTTTIMIY